LQPTILTPAATALVSTTLSNDQDHQATGLMSIDSLDTCNNWLADAENLPTIDFDDFIIRSPTAAQAGDVRVEDLQRYESSVRYTINRMKGWPAMFAKRGSTPFIHHTLSSLHGSQGGRSDGNAHFKPEDVMLDALSACALYTSRNGENGRAAIQDVRRKAKALSSMMLSEMYHPPAELLALMQALSLYQIIRLFDGDIELRAEAEADRALQGQWTDELMKYLTPITRQGMVSNTTSSVRVPTPANPKDWRQWIFEESVRRVTMVSIMIQQSYASMKHTSVPCTHTDEVWYTVQNFLWEAPSEYHWGVIWTEEPRYEACASRWDCLETHLKGDTCDDIFVILMVLMRGLDSTAQWLGKENLVRFGLDWNSMRSYLTYTLPCYATSATW
jgi:hypothetical protein